MALIRGQEVKKGPTGVPANPKMYNSIVVQAKSKFAKYPSPAAAHWVHTLSTLKWVESLFNLKKKLTHVLEIM